MSNSGQPTTPPRPPRNPTNDDSWKGLDEVNGFVFMKLVRDCSDAFKIQASQNAIVGKLRANPIGSLSKSYSSHSYSSRPKPSPKKSKVEDARGDTADADPTTKEAFTAWTFSADWKGDEEKEAVTKISEAWRRMLHVAPPLTETLDSQGSASSASTATESQSSSYHQDDGKLKFKIGKTHAEKLKFLEFFRTGGLQKAKEEAKNYCEDWEASNGEKTDPLKNTFEDRLTQPFVNDMIDAALPYLQAYAQPLLDQKQRATKLQYYCETKHSAQCLGRQPDGLLYVTGAETNDERDEPKLTKEAQQIGALISIESKSTLADAKKRNLALRELERDLAEKTKLENCLQPETMHGLMTDGVVWQFHEFQWKVEWGSACLIRKTSSEFRIQDSSSKLCDKNLKQIADWLVFVLKRSLEPCHQQFVVQVSIPLGQASITQIRPSHHLRPHVFKAILGEQIVAVKFFEFSKNNKDNDFQQKMANRLVKEREYYLKDLRDAAGIVRLVNVNGSASDLFNKYVLCMEDAGTALDDLIVSGRVGMNLALIVYRDIWEGALKALENARLCHNDIHPGNICVCMKNERAKLVDLESTTAIGVNLDRSPILLRENAPEQAGHSWDKAGVAAVLRCLWQDGSFENLRKYVEEYKNDSEAVKKFEERFVRWKKQEESQSVQGEGGDGR